ncbi:MAG: tetratricopeptide repeat protein [Acidobacteriota bacterium]
MKKLALALLMTCFPLINAQPVSPEGHWLFLARLESGQDLALLILEISAAQDGYQAQVLSASAPHELRVETVHIDESDFRLELSGGAENLALSGIISEDVIEGTLDGLGVEDAHFHAQRTSFASIQAFEAAQQEELEAVQSAIRLPTPEERITALRDFIQKHPQSRFQEHAYGRILDDLLTTESTDEEVLETAEEVVERASDRPMMMNNVAFSLAEKERLLDQAEKYAREAVSSLPDSPEEKANFLDTLGWVLFQKGAVQEAAAQLEKSLEASPGNPEIALHLAQAYGVLGKDQEALKLYARAYVNRGDPSVRAELSKLFEKVHGSLDGLQELIVKEHENGPLPFDPGKFGQGRDSPASGFNRRVVLAELFTGSECPPCQAADYAFEGLLRHYPRDVMAVLQYHVHIPRPDPLANLDAEQRRAAYGARSAPYAVFNGIEVQRGGGPTRLAGYLFQQYQQQIATQLEKESPVEIKGEAFLRGDAVQVRVETRTKDMPLDHLRLHVALAEKAIPYAGHNRVPIHSQVVRKLMGGPEGLALKADESGTSSFSLSQDLGKLESELSAYLDFFERETGLGFKEKLYRVNRSNLSVVAFVQNAETNEVLNALTLSLDTD